VEFFYNNALSATTSVSLFFANKIYYPNISIHSECNIAFSQAWNFAVDLNKLQSTLKAKITVAQKHYQKFTDMQHFSASDFKVNDKVFVKAQFFRTT